MKILVLSDSHAALSFMRYSIRVVKPDHVVHLGDYFDDGMAMAEEYPNVVFHQVPGNCDRYRCQPGQADILCYCIGGVKLYLTHGHKHCVKTGTWRLLEDARRNGAQAVLYGHTHCAACIQEGDGLWVVNPGTCGSYGGSVGLITVEQEEIASCRILRQEDLDRLS